MSDTASEAFASRLIRWQRAHGRRDLPWQQSRDAYRIWLSEVMLQQTQVATVVPYYARIVEAFPDVAALAAAPLSRVLELWSGLGYYRRAHHLHAAARAVVARFDGRFPVDAQTLATLPGIGRSTAAAIAAFASAERSPILDGNVKRVLARHRGVEGWPGEPRVEATLWREAECLLPDGDDMAAYTQAIMDLGAMICVRTRPLCNACPVADDCIARAERRTGELPTPRPKRALPKRAIVVLLIERDGDVLLERRPPTGVWPGLLSLPEVEVGADVGDACMSRFGVSPATIDFLQPITHLFTHFALEMRPARIVAGAETRRAAAQGAEWLDRQRAADSGVPAPIRRLLAFEGVMTSAALIL